MARKNLIRALGSPPRVDDKAALESWVKAVHEILVSGEGMTREGDGSQDRYLKLRDLTEAGAKNLARYGSGYSGGITSTNLPSVDLSNVPPYTSPEAPTNLVATGALRNIILEWEHPPSYNLYLAYYEVWRAESDDLGAAALIDQTVAPLISDNVGTSSPTYYYWVRAISTRDDESPFNAVNGVSAATSLDPQYVIDTITERLNDTGIPAEDKFIIESANFGIKAPGAATFALVVGNVTGVGQTVGISNAHIIDLAVTNAAIANAAIDTAKIADATITSAKIGDGQITNAKVGNEISSVGYSAGSTGWRITKDIGGTGHTYEAEFNNVWARGNILASGIAAGSVEAFKTLILDGRTVNFPIYKRDDTHLTYQWCVGRFDESQGWGGCSAPYVDPGNGVWYEVSRLDYTQVDGSDAKLSKIKVSHVLTGNAGGSEEVWVYMKIVREQPGLSDVDVDSEISDIKVISTPGYDYNYEWEFFDTPSESATNDDVSYVLYARTQTVVFSTTLDITFKDTDFELIEYETI